jgi:hypothetical protein
MKILSNASTTTQGVITDMQFQQAPVGWDVARFSREVDPEMLVVYVSGDSAPDWASKGVPNSIISGSRSLWHSWWWQSLSCSTTGI